MSASPSRASRWVLGCFLGPPLAFCAIAGAVILLSAFFPAAQKERVAPTVVRGPQEAPQRLVFPSPKPEGSSYEPAIALVARAIMPNELAIKRRDLQAVRNPKGEGTVIYVKQGSLSSGRSAIWITVGSKGFALNSAAKTLTPSLPWPREAPDKIWSRTKLDKYSAASELSGLMP